MDAFLPEVCPHDEQELKDALDPKFEACWAHDAWLLKMEPNDGRLHSTLVDERVKCKARYVSGSQRGATVGELIMLPDGA
jgi:hypothetical protein